MSLWEELCCYKIKWGDNWVIGGDFNMVLHMHERLGSGTRSGEVEEFREMVDNLKLVDLLLRGGRWTWSNARDIPSWSRIDRFLSLMGC